MTLSSRDGGIVYNLNTAVKLGYNTSDDDGQKRYVVAKEGYRVVKVGNHRNLFVKLSVNRD